MTGLLIVAAVGVLIGLVVGIPVGIGLARTTTKIVREQINGQ